MYVLVAFPRVCINTIVCLPSAAILSKSSNKPVLPFFVTVLSFWFAREIAVMEEEGDDVIRQRPTEAGEDELVGREEASVCV